MLVLASLVPDILSSSVISKGGGSRPRSREDALVGRSGLTGWLLDRSISLIVVVHLPTRALLSRFFFGRALVGGLIQQTRYSS